MIALDTNILLRCLTLDDPQQVPAAQKLLAHEAGVFIAKTVLLELEWVLRAAYKVPRQRLADCLLKLLGLPNVSVESEAQIAQALQSYQSGLDFADALHLAASQGAQLDEAFYTFDAEFVRSAAAHGAAVKLAGKVTPP